MKYKLSTIILAAALFFLLTGCRTYQPPQRPVAYMYPTLMSGTQLRRLTPQNTSPADLQSYLESMELWRPLVKAGLETPELETLSRSLARRGYAELDARRSACPVAWVAFMGIAPLQLQIVSGDTAGNITEKNFTTSPPPAQQP